MDLNLMHEEVKKVTDYLTTRVASPPASPLASSNLLRKEDFEHVKWWEPSRWQAVKSGAESRDLEVDGPIISLYMEDEHSRLIPESIKKALRRDLYGYWNGLYSSSSDSLRPSSELDLERRDHFRNRFEVSYPWLRLCSGHWKVDQLWLSYFHTWRKTRTLDPASTESSPSSTAAVKMASPPPIPSKRRLEEEEDSAGDPSKRRKGKAVDTMAPTAFHHSRPLPRKRKAAIHTVKVRLLASLFIIIVLIVHRVHCNDPFPS